MDTYDREIVDLIREKDKAWVKKLFDRYYRPLVLYARELVQHEAEAEDIVQDLFIRLWEGDQLKDFVPTSLSSYLFTAVRNACISLLKKKDVLRDGEVLKSLDIPIEVVSAIDDALIEQLEKEVQELPPRTKQVLESVLIQRKKYKETAEELGISVNTVKFLLKEANKRLRARLTIADNTLLLVMILRGVVNREP